MTDLKITASGWHKTRGGKKVWVAGPADERAMLWFGSDEVGGFAKHWYRDGTVGVGRHNPKDIVSIWKEPASGQVEGWVNIYCNPDGTHRVGVRLHKTRASADERRLPGHVACKRVVVDWVEGEVE